MRRPVFFFMTGKLIRLDPRDNVVVCARPVRAGERVQVDGVDLVIAEDVDVGHKIALKPLAVGDKIVKYGMPIGSMTAPEGPGGWVHMHNMKSDYLPAHHRTAAGDGA